MAPSKGADTANIRHDCCKLTLRVLTELTAKMKKARLLQTANMKKARLLQTPTAKMTRLLQTETAKNSRRPQAKAQDDDLV